MLLKFKKMIVFTERNDVVWFGLVTNWIKIIKNLNSAFRTDLKEYCFI